MADPIADDEVGPAALLEWGEPIGIAFYPDHATKTELIAKMRALSGVRTVHVVHGGPDALQFAAEHALIIVDTNDEAAAVAFFDHNRDHFVGDAAPARVLLLLLAKGEGERALADAPALASFAREASFELTRRTTVDVDAARADFEERYGMSPDVWLRQWREGELADTFENNYALGEALAISESS